MVELRFNGRLDAESAGALWWDSMDRLDASEPERVIVDAGEVDYCDGSGIGLLFGLLLRGRSQGFEVEIRGLKPEFQAALDVFNLDDFDGSKTPKPRRSSLPEDVGRVTVHLLDDMRGQITFVGELCASLANIVVRPWKLRWRELLLVIERAGADAVGLCCMIGFLFGLILAFSSAIPLQQFGAEIYVADLVALGMVRVLGAFITAILLAGRSGSAFAAELGTMKINDELDALTTMGLNPMSFLVVPRVLAAIIVMPLLALLTNLAALVGTGSMLLSLGYPLVTYVDHVTSATNSVDLVAGLCKAMVYGGLVGGVSCLRGLETQTGADAVGVSTTRAVVSSIVLVVVAEGVFAVLFYALGI
jgi:phospholipid/cholesterol/gamma-HCH transport system permease protein